MFAASCSGCHMTTGEHIKFAVLVFKSLKIKFRPPTITHQTLLRQTRSNENLIIHPKSGAFFSSILLSVVIVKRVRLWMWEICR